MTENEFTYWAFLGYSQQDNDAQRLGDDGRRCWGDWLRDVLKNFSIPADFTGQINARGEIIPKQIDPIFQDQEEQPGNGNLSESVRQALAQSKCLIVICSPHSAKSLHVNEAVRYFKQLGRGNRILPIVVAGEPNASDGHKPGVSPDDECFVPALRHPVNPDGTLDATRRDRGPIFADARHGADKREMLAEDRQNAEASLEIAKIQLIAGLIGVGFNELLRREQSEPFDLFPEIAFRQENVGQFDSRLEGRDGAAGEDDPAEFARRVAGLDAPEVVQDQRPAGVWADVEHDVPRHADEGAEGHALGQDGPLFGLAGQALERDEPPGLGLVGGVPRQEQAEGHEQVADGRGAVAFLVQPAPAVGLAEHLVGEAGDGQRRQRQRLGRGVRSRNEGMFDRG